MSSVESSSAVTPVSPAMRVVAAFTSPTALFRDILRDTTWWPAFVLLALSSMFFSFAVQKQVGWVHAYETILHQSPKQEAQVADLGPEKAQQQKLAASKFVSVTAYGSWVIILLVSAIAAAVLLGTLNFGFGGKARFSELFAVYMYAGLPMVLHSLLGAIALFAGLDSASFLMTNPVGSNPGYYLGSDTAKWILALASSLDVFTLWMLALLVLGCAIVARVSKGAAAAAVLGWWVLLVVLKVGSAALQG